MTTSLISILTITAESFLISYVALRAWEHPPARIALGVLLSLMLLTVINYLGDQVTDARIAYTLSSVTILILVLMTTGLLVLFSVMFVPEWWQGRRPIIWIMIPYGLALLALAVDLVGRFGLLVGGVQFSTTGFAPEPAIPGGVILLAVWLVGLLVVVVTLIIGFIRQPRYRLPIGLLMAALLVGLVISRLAVLTNFDETATGALIGLPLRLALAFLALRTSLLAPNQAGLALADASLTNTITVINREGLITYSNPAAERIGLTVGHLVDEPLGALGVSGQDARAVSDATGVVPTVLRAEDQIIELSANPIYDTRGRLRGTLLMGQNVTELAERNRMLEHERAELRAALERLEREQQERQLLAGTVRQLSLPLIPVREGVLALPLIGDFDEQRTRAFAEVLLKGIEHQRARTVLLDLTGITLLDAQGAAMLLRGVRAARLLGASCMLVGVRPETAQTLVAMGVETSELASAPTLQQAIGLVWKSPR